MELAVAILNGAPTDPRESEISLANALSRDVLVAPIMPLVSEDESALLKTVVRVFIIDGIISLI